MSIIAQKYAKIHSAKLRYSAQKLFLSQLAQYADENGEFFWSMERLAREWAINIKTVYRRFNEYVQKGILEATEKLVGKFKRIKTWRFIKPKSEEEEVKKEPVQDLILPMLGGSDTTYVGTIPSIYEKKEKEKKANTITPPPSHKKPPNHLPDKSGGESFFEKFWEAYPIKVGKKDCRTKWTKRKLDSKFEIIMAALEKQKQFDRQWLAGFSPNPLTYLEGDRWEDEVRAEGFRKQLHQSALAETKSTVKEFPIHLPLTDADRDKSVKARLTYAETFRSILGL